MLLALIAGCNADGQKSGENGPDTPTVIGTPPVSASDEVAAFFEKNSKLLARSVFEKYSEKHGARIPLYVDSCVMINSLEQYRQIDFYDDSLADLPIIDFDKYTLIIGQYSAADGGYYIMSQGVVVGEEEMTMNIGLGRYETHHLAAVELPFWGLYEKLPPKPIIVQPSVKK